MQVGFQYKDIKGLSQKGKGRGEVEPVKHQSLGALRFEGMIVPETSERSSDHLVAKIFRAIQDSDPHRHGEKHPQVSGPPFNLLAQPDQAGGYAANGAFLRICNRRRVKINTPSQVEAAFDWSVDNGLEFEFRG